MLTQAIPDGIICARINYRAMVQQKNDSRKPNYNHVLQYNEQCSSV
jgi:hypothetical protein